MKTLEREMESRKDIKRLLAHASRLILLVALCTVCWGTEAFGQSAVVFGLVPAAPGPYQRGQMIEIYGTDVYDLNNNNCDSVVIINNSTGQNFRFRASQTVTPFDYSGDDMGAGQDTINLRLPCTMADGNYTLYVFDDENCDNGCTRFSTLCGYSAGIPITISGATYFGTLTYGGNGYFCLGEPNPSPSSSPGTGVFTDLTSTGPSNNAVLNSATGQLALHSGWVGTPHIIEFNGATSGCRVRDTVRVKAVSNLAFSYPSSTYCKSVGATLIPTFLVNGSPASPATMGGTFASSPSLGASLNATTGVVSVSTTTPAGNYLITYTPNVDSCGTVATASFEIINKDSAIFNYLPEYCHNDPNGGYPASITSLPFSGGYFKDSSNTGISIDSTTGLIDLLGSNIGTHTISYVPNNAGCSVRKTDVVVIRDPAGSNFSVIDTVCANVPTVTCTPITPTAGIYYCPSGDILFLNSSTGVIDIANSNTGGPFTIFRDNADAVCPDSTAGTIFIQAEASATINYPNANYCQNTPNPLPIFVLGAAGGTYFANLGTVVDSQTGELDLAASNVGGHTVFYRTGGAFCPDTTSLPLVTIDPAPDPTFDLTPTAICQNSGWVEVDIVTPGGATANVWTLGTASDSIFVGAMQGDSINTNVITFGGPFKIKRLATLGACRDSFADFVYVNPEEDASFAYVPDSYCQADQNPYPVVLGNGGGTYVSDTGLVVAIASGFVNLALSNGGAHQVIHTTSGPCPAVDTAIINIVPASNPIFFYPGLVFCETDTALVQPDSIQLPFGDYVFSAFPPLPGLDSMTGDIDLSDPNNSPGNYTIRMTLTNTTGSCQGFFEREVTIDSLDPNSGALNFFAPPDTLGDNVFCTTEDSAIAVLNGIPLDGRFTSTPPTIAWLNRNTGHLSLSATPPGTYTISFIRNNACNDQLDYVMQLDAPTPVVLDYTKPVNVVATNFCKSDTSNPMPRLTPPTPGFFSYSPIDPLDVLAFAPDSSTGIIDLANTSPGFYRIFFNAIGGCPGSDSITIRILSGPGGTSLTLNPNDTICAGTSVTMVGEGSLYYEFFVNDTSVGVGSTNVVTNFVDGATIMLEIKDQFGCATIERDTMTVFPIPDGTPLSVDSVVTGSTPIDFDMGTDAFGTYFLWDMRTEGAVDVTQPFDSTFPTIDPSATFPISVTPVLSSDYTPGIVWFYFEPHAQGCTGAVDSFRVKIIPTGQDIFIPEVFTPDGNGFNDHWPIQYGSNINGGDYQIIVYNRGGGIVHTLQNLDEQWNGDGLPDGVYWYTLMSRIGEVVDKGAVTIRRK